MKLLLACLLSTPLLAHAETPPAPAPAPAAETQDARLVPTMKNDTFIGLKVYAIRAGGRFDQPTAPFLAGDLIEAIDGIAVTTPAGAKALHEKVILGKANAIVEVRRQGELVRLASKATR